MRQETGSRVAYSEGVASHSAPESCRAGREAWPEALTGVRVSQPWSGLNQLWLAENEDRGRTRTRILDMLIRSLQQLVDP